jgi:hypothetical protein
VAEKEHPSLEETPLAPQRTTTGGERPSRKRKAGGSILRKIAKEFEELSVAALVIFVHGLLIVFGVAVLSESARIIEASRLSDAAKDVIRRLDEYLMVLSFSILGVGFIIKIGLVVWSSVFRGRKWPSNKRKERL